MQKCQKCQKKKPKKKNHPASQLCTAHCAPPGLEVACSLSMCAVSALRCVGGGEIFNNYEVLYSRSTKYYCRVLVGRTVLVVV